MQKDAILVGLTVHRPSRDSLRKNGYADQADYVHSFVDQTTNMVVNTAPELLHGFVPEGRLLLTADFVDRHTNGWPSAISVEFRLNLPPYLHPECYDVARQHTAITRPYVNKAWEHVRPKDKPEIMCPVCALTCVNVGHISGIFVPTPMSSGEPINC